MGLTEEGWRDPLDLYGAQATRACQGRLQASNPRVPVAPWGRSRWAGLPFPPSLNSFSLRKNLEMRGPDPPCSAAGSAQSIFCLRQQFMRHRRRIFCSEPPCRKPCKGRSRLPCKHPSRIPPPGLRGFAPRQMPTYVDRQRPIDGVRFTHGLALRNATSVGMTWSGASSISQ